MTEIIKGHGGGGGKGGGGGSGRVAVEAPDSLKSTQYANIIDVISEGEIEGLVDGLKSIYLDDTPLQNADGTFNFTGVTVSTRNGTQSQEYIPGFSAAEAEGPVGVQIKQASSVVRSITNSNNTAVRVTLSVPQLSQQDTTNGDINGTSVEVAIDVQTDGGGFVPQPLRKIFQSGSFTYGAEFISNTVESDKFNIAVNWVGQLIGGNQTLSLVLQYRAVGALDWITHTGYSFSGNGSADVVNGNYSPGSFTSPTGSQTFSLTLASGLYEFRVLKTGGSIIKYVFNGLGPYVASGIEYGGSVSISYAELYAPAYTDVISGKTTSKYQRAYYVPLPDGDEWDVRVRRITADSTSIALQNNTMWDSYTEIIDAKLTYPNTALVALQIDSSQFNSIPVRRYEIKGIKVKLPSNYNPLTREYTGTWDGTFAVAWTDNPAWIFYDIVTNNRYGLGDLIGEDMIDKWGLYAIGKYCDEFVDDGYGGSEPRFTCNLYLQTREQAYQVLTNIASIFRAMVYWSSGSVYVSQDAPQDVSQIFSPANVVDGVFNYSGSSVKVRHTVVLVTWIDPLDNYLPKIEYVSDNDAISRFGVVQTDIVAAGCTSRGQAHRLGKMLLTTEQEEVETVSFKAGLDSVFIQSGSLIQTTDPVRAGKRMGGRLVAASTSQVTIDAAITIEAGKTYQISCCLANGEIETKAITNAAGSHTVIEVESDFTSAPQNYSMWVVAASDLVPEIWRVVSIAEVDKTQLEIVALAYRADKYAAVEQGLVLEPLQTSAVNAGQPATPTNLNVTESLYLVGVGVIGVKATVSWDSQLGINNYVLIYSKPGQNPVTITTSNTTVDIQPLAEGDYTFTLYAQNALGRRSLAQIVNVTIYGKTTPPNDVQSLQMIALSGYAHITWASSTDLDVLVGGYLRLRYTPELITPEWSAAVDIGSSIPGNSNATTVPLLSGSYLAKWVDSSGNASVNAVAIKSNVSNLITLNVAETVTESPAFLGTKNNLVYDTERGGLKITPASMISDWGLLSTLGYLSAEGGVNSSGEYYFDESVDLGSVQTSRLTAALEVSAFDANDFISKRGLISGWNLFAGTNINDVGVALSVRTTDDDPLVTPDWSEWQPFFVGDWTARAYEFKADFSTQDPNHNILLKSLAVTVDMPDRDAFGEDIASGTSGTGYVVTYSRPFIAPPALGITAQNMQTGDYYEITNKDTEGFTIIFKNAAGAVISRTFDFHAKGY